jgi:flagellar protein FlgJ
MRADFSSAYNYTDFQGFAELRQQAREGSPEAVDATARQFEALFIQMMLKSMRDAIASDNPFEGDQVKFYREMFDQQLALELSRGEGIGLRESLVRELAPPADTTAVGEELALPTQRVPARRATTPAEPGSIAPPLPAYTAVLPSDPSTHRIRETAPAESVRSPTPWRPDSPQAFVETLWPHAEAAAADLGVAPEVLLAQSALETGWGRHVIRRADGSSSYNLFGIKAHGGWQGERAHVGTLEYVNGIPERQRAAFRAYESPAESFADYVEFLQRNPRYRQALAQAPDAEGYLRGLQAAGYATDPQYANKILSILNQDVLQQRAALKSDPGVPTT